MSTMIQIRNVPGDVHRKLKDRAALLGKSMCELILDELIAMTAIPSPQELLLRLRESEPIRLDRSSAELIRQERDAA